MTISLARKLAAALEPVAGQVYFAPECHDAYVALGFAPSPGLARKVALPDGPAYFTSRGSCMGEVSGHVVAAAFAVFNPAAVVPSVAFGWSLTDARTIAAARARGATAQLVRILGESPAGLDRATELLTRATASLRPEGRPLFAGLLSLGLPDDPMGAMWRLADLLREYRGDSHTGAWISAGLDATEIGLLTELFLGLPMGTYIRSRAWSADELEAAKERLRSRGLIADEEFTDAGRRFRQDIEDATDRQVRPALDALNAEGTDELIRLLAPWGAAIREAGGYLAGGPGELRARERPGET